MYRKPDVNQLAFEDFVLPFGGKLRSDNRWGVLAKQIPWAAVEAEYAQQFFQEVLWFNENGHRVKSAWLGYLCMTGKWESSCTCHI